MALSTPFTLTKRGQAANTGVDAKYPHSQVVDQQPVRVASIRFSAVDALAVKGAALAASDVFELISIPAGAFVLGVTATVSTAEGAASTVDVGYGGDTDGFFDGLDTNSAATSFSWDEAPATLATTAGVGHFFSAADTIDLMLMTGTWTAFVVDISVTYVLTSPEVA